MDFDRQLPPWKQSKQLFHEYLNMQEFGFELDPELILIDMHGLSYFKTINENEFQIFIGFNQDTTLVHNFFCRIRISEIECSVNKGLEREVDQIDLHENTIEMSIIPSFKELRDKFIRSSREELKKHTDYKIALQNTAEIIRSDCRDLVIPALKEWTDIEKTYREIVIPICKEGKKVFGRDNYSDFVCGGYFSWLKVVYILNKYSDPYVHDFIDYFIKMYSPAENFKEDIKGMIKYVPHLNIKYDFSEVEKQLS